VIGETIHGVKTILGPAGFWPLKPLILTPSVWHHQFFLFDSDHAIEAGDSGENTRPPFPAKAFRRTYPAAATTYFCFLFHQWGDPLSGGWESTLV